MADLSLKDRLQPALLDRLIDDERYVTRIRVAVRQDSLASIRITVNELTGILMQHGLRRDDRQDAAGDGDAELIVLHFVAVSTELNPAQLKSQIIKPPGRPAGIALQEFCEIHAHSSLNEQLDLGEKGIISMRRLRDCVQRDLSWLLNSASLDSLQDLSRYPQVARSVVNYGMPTLSGRLASSIDIVAAATRIRDAVMAFEPRLSRVLVTPETSERNEAITLGFRIEAQLWGQPVPQHLVLRTSIDVESGDVQISEAN
jgi:type VI secretion system protein ImpF